MADIASLGITIDSSQAKTAAKDLDTLAASATKTATATGTLQKGGKDAADSQKSLAAQIKEVEAALRRLKPPADDAANAHKAMSTQAMAAFHSMRSFGESIALGVPLSTALTQQINHLSYAASGPGGLTGAFKEVGGMIAKFINPATIAIGTLALLTGGAYLAYSSWSKFALQLDETAKRAGTTSSEMSKLQAAASFKGISAEEFFQTIGKIADNLYLARTNAGGLAAVLRANGVPAATSVSDAMEKIADLIKRAKGDVSLQYSIMQQVGIPTTQKMVELFEQGAAGIRKAKEEATAFGGKANDEMVAKAKEFEEAWNKVITNFTLGWHNAFTEIYKFFDKYGYLINAVMHPITAAASVGSAAAGNTPAPGSFADKFMGVGTGTGPTQVTVNKQPSPTDTSKPKDPDAVARLNAQEQQHIQILGNLATVEQTVRAKQLEINAANAAGVGVTNEETAALLRLARQQAESAKLQKEVTFGIFDAGRQAENAKLELQTLIDDKTVKNSSDYAAAMTVIQKRIRDAADTAAVARSQFEGLTRFANDGLNGFKQFDQFAVSSLSNIENGIISFGDSTKTAKEHFADMTKAILADLEKMIIRMTVTAPLAKALAGAFGGGFSFGGGASSGGFASAVDAGTSSGIGTGGFNFLDAAAHHTGYGPGDRLGGMRVANFANAPRFHSGIGPGERPAIIRTDESVLTPGQMKQLAPSGRSGANITFAPNITVQGANSVSAAQLASVMTAQQKDFEARIVPKVRDAFQRGAL